MGQEMSSPLGPVPIRSDHSFADHRMSQADYTGYLQEQKRRGFYPAGRVPENRKVKIKVVGHGEQVKAALRLSNASDAEHVIVLWRNGQCGEFVPLSRYGCSLIGSTLL